MTLQLTFTQALCLYNLECARYVGMAFGFIEKCELDDITEKALIDRVIQVKEGNYHRTACKAIRDDAEAWLQANCLIEKERKKETWHAPAAEGGRYVSSDHMRATAKAITSQLFSVEDWDDVDVESVAKEVFASVEKVVPVERIQSTARLVVKLLKSTLHDNSRSLNDMVNVG